MHTVTRRAIARRNPNRTGLPTLKGFYAFLEGQGIERGTTGRPLGARVLTATVMNGSFMSATFRHPTKIPTKGRFATISWRVPEIA